MPEVLEGIGKGPNICSQDAGKWPGKTDTSSPFSTSGILCLFVGRSGVIAGEGDLGSSRLFGACWLHTILLLFQAARIRESSISTPTTLLAPQTCPSLQMVLNYNNSQ